MFLADVRSVPEVKKIAPSIEGAEPIIHFSVKQYVGESTIPAATFVMTLSPSQANEFAWNIVSEVDDKQGGNSASRKAANT